MLRPEPAQRDLRGDLPFAPQVAIQRTLGALVAVDTAHHEDEQVVHPHAALPGCVQGVEQHGRWNGCVELVGCLLCESRSHPEFGAGIDQLLVDRIDLRGQLVDELLLGVSVCREVF